MLQRDGEARMALVTSGALNTALSLMLNAEVRGQTAFSLLLQSTFET